MFTYQAIQRAAQAPGLFAEMAEYGPCEVVCV